MVPHGTLHSAVLLLSEVSSLANWICSDLSWESPPATFNYTWDIAGAKMKAAVVNKHHHVDVVDRQLRPLEYGEALLEMECCGVCHTDLHVKNGDFGDKTG